MTKKYLSILSNKLLKKVAFMDENLVLKKNTTKKRTLREASPILDKFSLTSLPYHLRLFHFFVSSLERYSCKGRQGKIHPQNHGFFIYFINSGHFFGVSCSSWGNNDNFTNCRRSFHYNRKPSNWDHKAD